MSTSMPGQAASPRAKTEVMPLTSIRGLAALWVVAFHLMSNLDHHGISLDDGTIAYRVLRAGQFGVDIFFILSGFIIAQTYRSLTMGGIPAFVFKRFARVYPLHFVVLSLMGSGVFVLGMLGRTAGDAAYFSYSALPYHYTLTFAWLGQPVGWNAPAWSLSIELLAYLAFPLLLLAIKRLSASARVVFAALCVSATIWTLSAIGFESTGLGAIARGLLGFTVGMLMQSLAPVGFAIPGIPSAALLALAVLATLSDASIAWAPIAAAVLIPALAGRVRDPFTAALATAPAVWLGRISYSVYLFHIPLMIAWLNLLRLPFFATSSGLPAAVFTASYLAVLLAVSHGSYSLIEAPARVALQGMWRRHVAQDGDGGAVQSSRLSSEDRLSL